MLPELQADISKLADFADTYDAAADDLLAVLDDLTVTNTTSSTSGSSCAALHGRRRQLVEHDRGFLETNEQNLISLAETSRPVLGLFAEYSPEYPCLLGPGAVQPDDQRGLRRDGDPALNLNIVGHPAAARPLRARRPAGLRRQVRAGLPWADRHRRHDAAAQNDEYYCPDALADGVDSPDGGLRRNPTASAAGRAARPAGAGDRARGPGCRSPGGSTAELDFVRSIIGSDRHRPADEVSDLVGLDDGAAAAGTQVMFR